MATAVRAPTERTGEKDWSPARAFLLVAAIWHLPLAAVGFLYDRSFPIGAAAAESDGSAHVFGIFEVNGWHTLAGLLVGLYALYFAIKPEHVRTAAIWFGIFHVGVTVSLMIWDPSTFWIASNTADQFIHGSSAIGGLVSGLATRRTT